MTDNKQTKSSQAQAIMRLTQDPDRATLVFLAIGRSEAEKLSSQVGSLQAVNSELTTIASHVESLMSTAEARNKGGFSQWVKLALGGPTQQYCLAEAFGRLDSMCLRMDAATAIVENIRQLCDVLQLWVDALQEALPLLRRDLHDPARDRAQSLQQLILSGSNACLAMESVYEKSAILRSWAFRARTSFGA